MKQLALVSVLVLGFSLACAAAPEKDADDPLDGADADTDTDADTDSDTDSDTDTDADLPFAMDGGPDDNGFSIDCGGSQCVYSIYTTAEGNQFELDITETSDSFLYNENHDAFRPDGREDGFYVYRLTLSITDDFDAVRSNSTSLFDQRFHAGSTFYFYASNGDRTDCVVTGHEPGYYRDWCSRVE